MLFFCPFQDSMKASIKTELPPLKLYKFHFKLMLRQAFTTKPYSTPPLPLVHNPQVTLWVGPFCFTSTEARWLNY